MPIRLKRLELHGFKSFAQPTTFEFDRGITAIVGPNGSGKSNIADAVRWVLGEQSYASLRGRRAEDVIFAGAGSRAPMGMGEVSLTLDNSSGELPLAFSEITVTRRAFRSGENHYLINGARVRLKDVAQLTASLGQAHTVIGQGLVDAVLSQRADERRGLFEHAAGITGLRLKHAEAERHLADSQANSQRLEDLLREIEPRLRSLERAARQAREYEQIHGQLQAGYRRWYGSQWREASARLGSAERAVESHEHELEAIEREQANVADSLRQVTDRVTDHGRDLAELDNEVEGHQIERRRCEHALALSGERITALETRRTDLAGSIQARQATLSNLDRERSDAETALATVELELTQIDAELERLEQESAAARERRQAIERRLAESRASMAEIERELQRVRGRLAAHEQTLRDHAQSRQQLQTRAVERECQRGEIGSKLAEIRAARDRCRATLDELTARRMQCEERQAHISRERGQATDDVRALERQAVDLSARLDALERLRESGAGLQAGTRAVIEAGRAGRLRGIVGTLAELLHVPAELETAIEAALGGHLHDVVVERWSDAEQAIEDLKRRQAGRATFQPLDSVRYRERQPPPARLDGTRGIAADLVDYDVRIRPIVTGLLSRVIVADDLPTAHRLLARLQPGWSIVTVSGEIVRSAGTLTGGARVRESGTLAREREWRELPRHRQEIEIQLEAARGRLASLVGQERELKRELGELERREADSQRQRRDVEHEIERQRRWLAELEREAAQGAEALAESDWRSATLNRELAEFKREIERLECELAEAAAQQAALEASLPVGQDETRERRLQDLRALHSAFQERRHQLTVRIEQHGRERGRLIQEIEQDRQRDRILVSELARHDEERRALAEQRTAADCRLNTAETKRERLRQQGETLQLAELHTRQRAEELARRLLTAEREHDRLALDATRRRDELDLLIERAAHDLDHDDPVSLLASSPDEPVPEGLEREIGRLRERLRRIGLAGEDAIEQYEREAERYAYLRQQLDDVESATTALRALMAELERSMAGAFDRTFSEVAQAFETTFRQLFGGGKARLVQDKDGAGGIEIFAQPPGKRLQSLALLSGGERALTAVALLFAILKVNPSPFCLLDEVDAALDESNVVRVRRELRALAERTQFVIVTHNRGTIEGADTLYGITMGDEGISRVLSLRLPAETTA